MTLPATVVSFPLLAGASGALLVTVVSFPLFAGVSEGVRACMPVMVRYAASLHGMAKLELWPLLVLNILPSCSCVLLHLDLSWRSCLQALFRRSLLSIVVGRVISLSLPRSFVSATFSSLVPFSLQE